MAEERDQELAQLLSEVRALRESLDALKQTPPFQARPPTYEVAVRQLPPDYAVAVRQSFLPPDYEVMVRVQRPFERVVNPVFRVPTYNVAVSPGFGDIVDNPIVDQ